MEFCEQCQNMLYLRTEEDGTLDRYCRNCDYSKKEAPGAKAIKVSRTLYSEDDMLFVQHQNPHLRHDPTLPRVVDKDIQCPNSSCTGPRDKPQVLFVKYHPVNMKYFYCCDYCGHCWRLS